MPATPQPPGETSPPRNDEVRWVEPVFVEPMPAPQRRESLRWREVGWVEFAAAEETAREQEAQLWFVSRVAAPAAVPRKPELVEPELVEPELVEPTVAYIPLDDAVEHEQDQPEGREDQEEIAVYLSDLYEYERQDDTVGYLPQTDETVDFAEAEEAIAAYFPEQDGTPVYIPEEDGSLELYAPALERTVSSADRHSGLAWLRDFARNSSQGLSRVTIAAGILAVLAALSYYGGEHVAGLAGAMTPPQTPALSTASVIPTTAPKAVSLGPAPAPIDEAGARAASYLGKAKAGDMVAQYNVAVLYARGEGLAQDFTSAAAWFAKAADAGSSSAQFNLGVMYQRGLGVRQDAGEAFRWYRRAADRHYSPAEYNLAVAYADGLGTPADPVAAARWYHQAAVQGLVPAMINFAILYEKGEGVERSLIDAYTWYWNAGQRGDAIAEKRANELLGLFDANKKRLAQSQALNIAGTIRQTTPEMTPLPTAADSDTPAPIANSENPR